MPRYIITKWPNTMIKQKRKRNLMYRRQRSTGKKKPKLALSDYLNI